MNPHDRLFRACGGFQRLRWERIKGWLLIAVACVALVAMYADRQTADQRAEAVAQRSR